MILLTDPRSLLKWVEQIYRKLGTLFNHFVESLSLGEFVGKVNCCRSDSQEAPAVSPNPGDITLHFQTNCPSKEEKLCDRKSYVSSTKDFAGDSTERSKGKGVILKYLQMRPCVKFVITRDSLYYYAKKRTFMSSKCQLGVIYSFRVLMCSLNDWKEIPEVMAGAPCIRATVCSRAPSCLITSRVRIS